MTAAKISFKRARLSPEQKEVLDNKLLAAARGGRTEDVRALLDKGADIHVQDDFALRLAAMYGHTETVKLLLDRGADIHARDDSALRMAARCGRTETVRLLLDRGADIHTKDDEALCWAAWDGQTDTVKLLLDRDADVVQAGGKELIAQCKQEGREQVAELLEYHLPEQKEARRKAEARRQMLEAAAKGVPPRPSDIARDREIARIREAAGIRSPFPTMWRSNKPKDPQP